MLPLNVTPSASISTTALPRVPTHSRISCASSHRSRFRRIAPWPLLLLRLRLIETAVGVHHPFGVQRAALHSLAADRCSRRKLLAVWLAGHSAAVAVGAVHLLGALVQPHLRCCMYRPRRRAVANARACFWRGA